MIDSAEAVELVDARLEFAFLDVGHPCMRKIVFAVVPFVRDLVALRVVRPRRARISFSLAPALRLGLRETIGGNPTLVAR